LNAEQKGKSVKSDDDEMYLQAIITVFSHRELSAVSSDDLHSKNIKIKVSSAFQMEHTQIGLVFFWGFRSFLVLEPH
jgi:hypothetical protein